VAVPGRESGSSGGRAGPGWDNRGVGITAPFGGPVACPGAGVWRGWGRWAGRSGAGRRRRLSQSDDENRSGRPVSTGAATASDPLRSVAEARSRRSRERNLYGLNASNQPTEKHVAVS